MPEDELPEERRDDAALETLVAYNREDARNLETVMDEVYERLVESGSVRTVRANWSIHYRDSTSRPP